MSGGLAHKGDFEPTIAAHMRGLEPIIFANEPRFRLLAAFDPDGEVRQALVRCRGIVMISARALEVHHASPDADRTHSLGNGPGPPAAFPKGKRYLPVADELETLFTDDAFLALFPTYGQPAQPPWQLALMTILQFAEGLCDR
jgi:hypothetical protein